MRINEQKLGRFFEYFIKTTFLKHNLNFDFEKQCIPKEPNIKILKQADKKIFHLDIEKNIMNQILF